MVIEFPLKTYEGLAILLVEKINWQGFNLYIPRILYGSSHYIYYIILLPPIFSPGILWLWLAQSHPDTFYTQRKIRIHHL